MAGFQTVVRYDYAFGTPGEIKYDGPVRAQAGFIVSASAAYNIIGATAFTQANTGGQVAAGGTNPFFGLLANPKVMASFGTSSGGPLAPTMTLPNNVEAEFLQMGYMVASVPAACNIGDLVCYNTTTGALSTVAPSGTCTGIVAMTTGVITVSAIGAAGNIGIGSKFTDGSGNTVGEVVELGSGTGGNGTYYLNTAFLSAGVGSEAMTFTSAPPTGTAFVPKCVVDKFPQTTSGGGLALIKITN